MSAPDDVARAACDALLRRLRGGRFTVVEHGVRRTYGEPADLEGTMRVADPRTWRLAALRGGVGLGEGYMLGYWDSDDVVSALRLLARNLDRLNGLWRNRLPRLRSLLQAIRMGPVPSADDDRRNIRAHYDLGDDFFRLFLDPTMAYSCALFIREGMSLRDAQLAKFEAIASSLQLTSQSHLLEIGTGWGGFAMHAARTRGCRVTTTTISERQFQHARRAVHGAGLDDRITVLREHYRAVRGEFTHLVSIEMIEAVDWRLYDEFFAVISRLLRNDGVAAIQAIIVDDREFERSKRWQDFMKRYIFPGGCLPSVAAMLDTTRRATDLSLVELRDIGAHYVPTLRTWRESLDANRQAVAALGFDERFLRMWRYYLASCEAGFAERRISDVQVVFAKPGWRGHVEGAARHRSATAEPEARFWLQDTVSAPV